MSNTEDNSIKQNGFVHTMLAMKFDKDTAGLHWLAFAKVPRSKNESSSLWNEMYICF